MKASIGWLKDYVAINESPKELAHKLIMAGVHVASVTGDGDDAVLEFEITANRNDCLSLIGIAREIAAINRTQLNVPKDLLDADLAGKSAGKALVGVRIEDKDLCPWYTARISRGIKISASPAWLVKKLESVGLRTVNNVVDITNFLLMETGQALHAFDMDKIKGDVVIRRAKKGETIKVIDGSLKTLEAGMLVIADSTGPIAIAGIMGGMSTEVASGTKNILLESAFFDPVSVRRTSRKLGLGTDASYRFERKVDQGMIIPASYRSGLLTKELAGGETGELIIAGEKNAQSSCIKFSPEKAAAMLGLNIPKDTQKNILLSLGFKTEEKGDTLLVTVPGHRRDIYQEACIVEEIARINGYGHIPETIPPIVGNVTVQSKGNRVAGAVREALSGLGLYEMMSLNLIPETVLDHFRLEKDSRAILINPLSQDQAAMTGTLFTGVLKSISYNVNRKNLDLGFFELGNVYTKEGAKKYKETPMLAMAITGATGDDWISGRRKVSFYDMKGIVEALCAGLGVEINTVDAATGRPAHFSIAAKVLIKGKVLGYIGKISKEVCGKFDIREDIYAAELDMSALAHDAVLDKRFAPIPRFPGVVRDISMVCDETLSAQKIRDSINATGAPLVKCVSLMSIYKGEHIPKGKTGILYRIEYRDDVKTLTEAEVDAKHEAVKKELASGLGIGFR